MDFSKEFNRTDDNYEHDSTQINHEEINKNEIEDHLYDVEGIIDDSKNERRFNKQIDMHEISKPVENSNNSDQIHQAGLTADSGDVNNCPNNDNEHLQSDEGLIETSPTPEDSLAINEYQYSNINDNETTIKFHHHLKTKYSFITEHPLTHVDSQHAILIEQDLAVISNQEQLQAIPFDNEVQTGEKSY